ncbi:MAG: hypothetical protein LBC71_05685 [Oscillospiraceae bacterium]|jgi:DNA polymerase III delta prime subunit|nr:hypothetical protein [Oscillospiraceae bacterium]
MNLDTSRLSHAYITDKNTAEIIAMAALCSSEDTNKPCYNCINCDKIKRHIHPDITYIKRFDDKREILVDQIRDIKRDVYIAPNEADKKVYIVYDADTMNRNAQNAFLNVLEEPPPHVVSILVTTNPATLLPTVRSRCIEIFSNIKTDAEQNNTEIDKSLLDDFIKSIGNDDLLLTQCMFRLEKLDKTSLSAFLTAARQRLAQSLRNTSNRNCLLYAETIITNAEEMLFYEVGSGHIAGMMLASLISNKEVT